MKIVFVARLHKLDESRLGFYVPSNVSEYYDLETGLVNAGLSWRGGDWDIIDIRFTNYKGRLRGVFDNKLMPEVGTLVQVTLEIEK
jgi:hypothetical protein